MERKKSEGTVFFLLHTTTISHLRAQSVSMENPKKTNFAMKPLASLCPHGFSLGSVTSSYRDDVAIGMCISILCLTNDERLIFPGCIPTLVQIQL